MARGSTKCEEQNFMTDAGHVILLVVKNIEQLCCNLKKSILDADSMFNKLLEMSNMKVRLLVLWPQHPQGDRNDNFCNPLRKSVFAFRISNEDGICGKFS